MILGIDPGRGKTGWAIVDGEGSLLLSGIFPTAAGEGFFQGLTELSGEKIEPFVLEGRAQEIETIHLTECVMGNGTGKNILLSLAQNLPVNVKLVPEKGTTLKSRDLYWKIHPPRGVQRILPASLRVPPRDVDDLAAWAIVLRYLEQQEEKGRRRDKDGN